MSVDPLVRWCAEHQEEIQEFAGQYVAISARRGILAHGMDFARVYEEGRKKDPLAIFHLVPDAGVMVLWLG